MLLLTIVLLLGLLACSYKLFDKDLFAPPTVVCMSFLFSTSCAFYNEDTWALDFSGETTLVMLVGIGSFILGGILAVFMANSGKIQRFGFSHQVTPVQYIDIEKWKIIVIISFQALLMVLLYRELNQKVGFVGISWAEIMQIYRHESMGMVGQDYATKLSFLVKQFIGINTALVFLISYIVGNNLASKKKVPLIYWFPIILGCVLTFMQGFRADMLRYWVAILVVWYTWLKRSTGWKSTNKETFNVVKKMLLSALIVAMVFASVRVIVGRRSSANEWGPLYYVTFYGGCPVAALDLFLKEPNNDNSEDIWGKETFYYLNQSIGAWLDMPEYRYSIAKKGFQKSNNGTYVGNVYTALRHPIADFGYGGLPVVMLTMGIFFTFFYCKVRKRSDTHQIDFLLLIYSYCAYTFFMYFFSAYYFFISTTFIKTLLLWYFLRWLLTSRYVIRIGKRSSTI